MTWIRVAAPEQIAEGRGIVVNKGPISLAIFRHQGSFYALDNECPHQHGPLGMGWIEGEHVVCPLHHWKFDVRTGGMPLLPHLGVRPHPVEVRADGLYVEFPDEPASGA